MLVYIVGNWLVNHWLSIVGNRLVNYCLSIVGNRRSPSTAVLVVIRAAILFCCCCCCYYCYCYSCSHPGSPTPTAQSTRTAAQCQQNQSNGHSRPVRTGQPQTRRNEALESKAANPLEARPARRSKQGRLCWKQGLWGVGRGLHWIRHVILGSLGYAARRL